MQRIAQRAISAETQAVVSLALLYMVSLGPLPISPNPTKSLDNRRLPTNERKRGLWSLSVAH